jgi:uncharacterized protein
MTIKDAILKSLEEIGEPAKYERVYQYIKDKNHHDFGDARTPLNSVSTILGHFIRNGDTRVKRITQEGTYSYYLATNEYKLVRNEEKITEQDLTDETETKSVKIAKGKIKKLTS